MPRAASETPSHLRGMRGFQRLAVYVSEKSVMIPAQALGGNSAQRRSMRVATPPIPVRIAGTHGRLINISATGAQMQIQRDLDAGRVWPMLIGVEPEPVELHVRVVRSRAVSIQLPHATWRRQEFSVALAFTVLHPAGRALLQKLCGPAYNQFE